MIETLAMPLLESLAQALDTMGFIVPFPAEDPSLAPADLRHVCIEFECGGAGQIEILAPLALGSLLAANMLGVDAGDESAAGGAEDSLRELMNVTCGALLRRVVEQGGPDTQMGLPAVGAGGGEADWAAFVAREGTQVLDADGNLIAIRLNGSF